MDRWMANPALNANANVAKWHESAQKFGFKFLVTQIMGYLTGGPQRYTGRSMAAAHKHLNITPAQWDTFIQDAKNVMAELEVEAGLKKELIGILQSFRTDCIVDRGETAAPDPGRPKPAPGSEGTLYYRLGGVYPIAQFVDRLVEAVLKGDRVKVDMKVTEDERSQRHPPGLKYMVTELVCNCTGGPEVVTSKGFDDAKLCVLPEEWPTFLELANEAAEMWPNQLLRTQLLNALTTQKAEICIDVQDEAADEAAEAMRKIQAAGFNNFDATAALERCSGDAAKALDLLTSGWSADRAGNSNSSVGMGVGQMSLGESTGGYPGGGRCPFAAGAAAAPTPAVSALDERTSEAVRTLADKGIPAAQIAALLQIDEAAVNAATGAGAHVGRVLGSNLQEKLDDLLTEDPDLCCPVALVLFEEPVVASDGFMYEKSSLQAILRTNAVSPMTREKLKTEFFPGVERKKKALEFRESRAKELLAFADEAVAAQQKQMADEAAERAVEYVQYLGAGKVAGLAAKVTETYAKLGKPAPNFRP